MQHAILALYLMMSLFSSCSKNSSPPAADTASTATTTSTIPNAAGTGIPATTTAARTPAAPITPPDVISSQKQCADKGDGWGWDDTAKVCTAKIDIKTYEVSSESQCTAKGVGWIWLKDKLKCSEDPNVYKTKELCTGKSRLYVWTAANMCKKIEDLTKDQCASSAKYWSESFRRCFMNKDHETCFGNVASVWVSGDTDYCKVASELNKEECDLTYKFWDVTSQMCFSSVEEAWCIKQSKKWTVSEGVGSCK